MALSKSQICFAGMSWLKLKYLFLHRYEGIEPPSAVLLNILNGRPNANKSLSVYGSRLVTSLLTMWKEMSQEQVAVSFFSVGPHVPNRSQAAKFRFSLQT